MEKICAVKDTIVQTCLGISQWNIICLSSLINYQLLKAIVNMQQNVFPINLYDS